ncbi:MAG: hypothetical protein HYW77_03480 [Parcubacteria group bacterium]|nr:hypothetical protein [Parcubacteria group bacterium]
MAEDTTKKTSLEKSSQAGAPPQKPEESSVEKLKRVLDILLNAPDPAKALQIFIEKKNPSENLILSLKSAVLIVEGSKQKGLDVEAQKRFAQIAQDKGKMSPDVKDAFIAWLSKSTPVTEEEISTSVVPVSPQVPVTTVPPTSKPPVEVKPQVKIEQKPTPQIQLTSSEASVLKKLAEGISKNPGLASQGQEIINICIKAFSILREESFIQEGSALTPGSIDVVRYDLKNLFKAQSEYVAEYSYGTFRENLFNTFRRLVGTEVLKLVEESNQQKPNRVSTKDVPFQIREQAKRLKEQELSLARKSASLENKSEEVVRLKKEIEQKRTELGEMAKKFNIPSGAVNEYAKNVSQRIALKDLLRITYGDEDAERLNDISSLYEITNRAVDVRFGIKAWHDPLFHVTNMKKLVDDFVKYRREIKAFVKEDIMKTGGDESLVDKVFNSYAAAVERVSKFLMKQPDKGKLGLSQMQRSGIVAEKFIPDEEYYKQLEKQLLEAEASFIADTKSDAEQKEKSAKSAFAEALFLYEHPFDAINLIRQILSDRNAARFLNNVGGEMEQLSASSKVNVGEKTLQTLALISKESEASKNAVRYEQAARASADLPRKSLAQTREEERLELQARTASQFADSIREEIVKLTGEPQKTGGKVPTIEIPEGFELEDLTGVDTLNKDIII